MMLSSSGFDLWADGYDQSVNLSEEADEYPFAGYKRVLNSIYNTIRAGHGNKILDVGLGTGVLAKRLYDDGYRVYGIDFSDKMIGIARKKMPDAVLIRHDFSQGLPNCLENESFDYIICTYAIHHLDNEQKVKFIHKLKARLFSGGRLLIGDVAFRTEEDLRQCQVQSKEQWDEEECYPAANILEQSFPDLEFEQISFCAGILTFQK